jgi:hypothetical protein
MVRLSLPFIVSICGLSTFRAASQSPAPGDGSADSPADPTTADAGTTTTAKECKVSTLHRGYYYGHHDPVAHLELNVFSDTHLSMVLFFSMDSRVIFRGSAMEYKFDPSTCGITFVSGDGDYRYFGKDGLNFFSKPSEIIDQLKLQIPDDAPVDLSKGLFGKARPDGMVLLDVFFVKRVEDPRNWLEILQAHGSDMDWSLNKEEIEDYKSFVLSAPSESNSVAWSTLLSFVFVVLSI